MAKVKNQQFVQNPTTKDRFKFWFHDLPAIQWLEEYVDWRDEDRKRRFINSMIKSVSWPEITSDEQGRPTPYHDVTDSTNDLMYNPLTITFQCDENYIIYNVMLIWLYLKKSPTRYGGLLPDSEREQLFVDGTLQVMDNHEDVVSEFICKDLHPNSVGGFELEYGNDEYISFDVELSFSYYMPQQIYEDEV